MNMGSGGRTHGEFTTLVSFQRYLMETSGKAGIIALRTYLTVHHGVTDIFDQVTKPIHALGSTQEPCDSVLLLKWNEALEDGAEFPSSPCTSDRLSTAASEVTV